MEGPISPYLAYLAFLCSPSTVVTHPNEYTMIVKVKKITDLQFEVSYKSSPVIMTSLSWVPDRVEKDILGIRV